MFASRNDEPSTQILCCFLGDNSCKCHILDNGVLCSMIHDRGGPWMVKSRDLQLEDHMRGSESILDANQHPYNSYNVQDQSDSCNQRRFSSLKMKLYEVEMNFHYGDLMDLLHLSFPGELFPVVHPFPKKKRNKTKKLSIHPNSPLTSYLSTNLVLSFLFWSKNKVYIHIPYTWSSKANKQNVINEMNH